MIEQQKSVSWVKQALKILFWLGFVIFFVYSFQTIMDLEDIFSPRRLETFRRIISGFLEPNPEGETYQVVVENMWETVQIGFLATTISAIFAIPISFLSARSSSWWGRGFYIILQPLLAAVRAVHPLYLVLFTVVFGGIGPVAGVLALTIFSTAVLIKIFSEYAQEHISISWTTLIKVHYPGLALKHLSVNILIATILGFFAGGGIGFFLRTNIGILSYGDASIGILACIIVIGSLDLIGQAVWRKIQASA